MLSASSNSRRCGRRSRGSAWRGSHVASAAREEFEADLADFGALAVPRYALVCVDVFSRMGAAIPLRRKSAEAMVPALDEVMRQMGTPVRIVTDNGAEFDNITVVSHLKRLGVELVTIQSFASHVERFIRTIKTQVNVQLRIQKEPLTELLPDLISAYNKEKHSATKMEPLMAARDDEHDVVRGRLNKNLRLVKRPQLEVGDIVKIARPHSTGKSVMTPQYFGRAYIIEGISFDGGVKRYKVNGELYLRHDLLKISDVRRRGQTSAFEDKPEVTKQMERQFARQKKRAKALGDVFIDTTKFIYDDPEPVQEPAQEPAQEPEPVEPAAPQVPVQELAQAPHAADRAMRDAARELQQLERDLADLQSRNAAAMRDADREPNLAERIAAATASPRDLELQQVYDHIRRTGGEDYGAIWLRRYLAHVTGKPVSIFSNGRKFRDLDELRREIRLLRSLTKEQIGLRVASEPKYRTIN
jgi:transposase InsO family protein